MRYSFFPKDLSVSVTFPSNCSKVISNTCLLPSTKFTKEEIQMFKQGETPKHYTWHHHQDTGRMQLVDYQIHHDTGHTGGYKILGKDSDK